MNILLFGAGGHARVIADAFLASGQSGAIVGVVDEARETVTPFFDCPILDWNGFLNSDVGRGIVAVGDNWTRFRFVQRILHAKPNFEFVTAVHPRAIVSARAKLGVGTVVFAGAVVNAGCSISTHCIINTGAILEHDCVLDRFSSVGPGAALGGGAKVGEFSAIGLGANVLHLVNIGKQSVIGAGSVVTDGIEPFTVNYGVPSRKVRLRTEGTPYL